MSTRYGDRIERLAAEARAAREALEPGDPPEATEAPAAREATETENSSEPTETRAAREAAESTVLQEIGITAGSDPEERALVAARDGLGPVIAVYVEARTAAEPVRFSERDLSLLHRATADWLAVYTRCYGVETDPSVTVREAAEVLVDTHDVTDVAALLTGVPER